ncbi:MAG: hypothetical protein J7501_04545 [Bdellovibrio sp.]|nr:hypothetical protein [Bdellovibrio sp.]
MKLGLFVIGMLTSVVALAQIERTSAHSGTYSMSVIKAVDMKCSKDQMRAVYSEEGGGKILAHLCDKEYRQCMRDGSCVIEDQYGERMGLNYSFYNEKKNRSFFAKVDLKKCTYGYGMGRIDDETMGSTCLIPYFTISTDPTEYKIGDVLFIQDLVGVKLSTGIVHDGYVIVADYAEGYIGSGNEMMSIFTGTDAANTKANALSAIGFSDFGKGFQFRTVSEEKAKEVREKRGFKVVRTWKKSFVVPGNPMLDGQE